MLSSEIGSVFPGRHGVLTSDAETEREVKFVISKMWHSSELRFGVKPRIRNLNVNRHTKVRKVHAVVKVLNFYVDSESEIKSSFTYRNCEEVGAPWQSNDRAQKIILSVKI